MTNQGFSEIADEMTARRMPTHKGTWCGGARAGGETGFTIAEMLIYLMISAVVIASIFQLLIGQNQLYMKQRELTDVRTSLRAAAALLAWELRQASASGGDIYTIGTNSFVVRSTQGSGVICAEHETLLRYGIYASSGEFFTTSDDSALVFNSGPTNGSDDDGWNVVRITDNVTPGGSGVPTCFWGDTTGVGRGKGQTSATGKSWSGGSVVPDMVLEISGDVDDVYIGASIKAFRSIEYGLYQEDSRWWLGRKLGGAASYEKLTGPLRAPTDSGLVLTYYDQTGTATADPTQVAMVEVILRGESFGKVRQGSAVSAQQDSLRLYVSTRG